MQRFTIFAMSLLMAGGSNICLPASPAIGMVIARGTFQIDQTRVSGNATLLNGSTVQTGKVLGDLQLNSGARMQLAADSRGRVYQDHLVLEQGAGQLQKGAYQIEARTLRIAAGEPNATGRIALSGA